MTTDWNPPWICGATLCLTLGCIVVSMGCQPELPQRDAPDDEPVEAMFEPDEQLLPMPNDIAMEDGRLPELPGAEPDSAAGELSDYMAGLGGWPRTMAVEIPFSGPLNEESLDEEAVRMYRVDSEDTLVRADIQQLLYKETDEGHSVVEVVPADPSQSGESYAVVVTDRLEDEDGQPVAAALPTFLAASEMPLVDDDNEPTLDILVDEPDQARDLERMRRMLRPVYDAIGEGVGEDDPIERDEVVAAFRWTVMPQIAAAFHPDAQQLPVPNNAALDEDGTFPESATCHAGEESARGVLDDYLASLTGWPPETPITVTVTGGIDPDSIGDDDVQLWRRVGDDWQRDTELTVEYRDHDEDPCSGEQLDTPLLELTPGEPMATHEEYFAFVTRDIYPSDAADDDAELLPELPMLVAMQPHEIVDDDGHSTISTLSDDEARALVELRDTIGPAIEAIEQREGLGWDDLAAVFRWHTWNDTFVPFAPDEQKGPFPNSTLMDDDEEFVQMFPVDDNTPRAELIDSLNGRAGFSPLAAGWIPLDGPVDPESFDSETVRFFDRGELAPADDGLFDVELRAQLDRIAFEPTAVLAEDSEYVGAITDDMTGENGRPIQPSPFVVLLRNEHPVAEDGESNVDMLTDEEAVHLEQNRVEFNAQVDFLGGQLYDDWGEEDGTNRENVAAVWTFETEPQQPTEPMRRRRAMVRHLLETDDELQAHRACEVTGEGCDDDPDFVAFDDEFDHPGAPEVQVETSHLRAMHRGAEFEAVYADDGAETVGFSVLLPETDEDGADCEPPYQTVIAGHGFGADRWEAALAAADELAASRCLATVALDFPHHGGRTASADTPHPETTPEDSGDDFWTDDLVATTDNLEAAVSDLFALARIAEGPDGDQDGLDGLFEELDDDGPLFDGVVGYVGLGLGGIVGVPFAAVEPSVRVLGTNGAGGRIGWMLEGDEQGPGELATPLVESIENEIGAEAAGGEHFETAALAQWHADHVDPFVHGENTRDGGVPVLSYDPDQDDYTPATDGVCDDDNDCEPGFECESVGGDDVCVQYTAETDALVQMAHGERTVVNRATERLAEQLGAPLGEATFEDADHGFVGQFDDQAGDYQQGRCARRQIGAWFDTALDGDAQLPEELEADICTE